MGNYLRMHLEARNIRILCANNYELRLKLFEVTEENPAVVFRHVVN